MTPVREASTPMLNPSDTAATGASSFVVVEKRELRVLPSVRN